MEKYKFKSTVYLVFLLVSLFINGVLLYMLIVDDIKNDEEVSEPKVNINQEELVNEAIKVYEKVYNIFNSEHSNFYITNYEGQKGKCALINFSEIDEYFTTKALTELSHDLTFQNGIYTDCNNNLKNELSYGLFGTTHQKVKDLKYVSSNDDTLIVSGQLEYDEYVNSDNYPLYMILKYEDNKWKIEQFD